MRIEAIYDEWDKDSIIDNTELGNEANKIPILHNKYFRILTNERLVLRKYESDMNVLRLAKQEFYIQGPSEETKKKGWVQPSCGRILKPDVKSYIDADPDVVKLSLRIGVQHEKVDLLDSIIKSLNARGFNLKTTLEFEKFRMGGY